MDPRPPGPRALPVVAVGGSAGALEPLRDLVAGLPADFPAAVVVVIHCPPDMPSYLAQILRASSALPVVAVQQPSALQAGRIYVAPPDRHLLVGPDEVRPGRGPRENRSRPSVDVLFRSAAYTHRASVIGVLLSGMLGDGTSGLWTIKRLGGQAIVQHPEEAQYASMPLSALQAVAVDAMLPVRDMAGDLRARLAAPDFGQREAQMNEHEWRRLGLEVSVAGEANAFAGGVLTGGEFSAFTCPECHGAMVKIEEDRALRFRCHTGHAYSAPALLSELRQVTEVNMWNTLRGLEEHLMLLEHLAKHSAEADQLQAAELYRAEGLAVGHQIAQLRPLLVREDPAAPLLAADMPR